MFKTLTICLLAAFSLFAFAAGQASAAPDALDILVIDSLCVTAGHTDDAFLAELRAEPGVASVHTLNAGRVADGGSGGAPPAYALESDAIILLSDCAWDKPVDLGDTLANFVDRGRVVIAPNNNFSAAGGLSLQGYWASGGYSPFATSLSSADQTRTLGAHNASNPIFANVWALTNGSTNPATSLAPGATRIANWSDGSPAVALKSSVLGYNGSFADGHGGNGLDGRFVVNAINQLMARDFTVDIFGTGSGRTEYGRCVGTPATLCVERGFPGRGSLIVERPGEGSVFTGWTGACRGNLELCPYQVGYPGSAPSEWTSAAVGATFATTKFKLGAFKRHLLTATFHDAGTLVLRGRNVKTQIRTFSQPSTLKLRIKATGTLKKKLAKRRSVKVTITLNYRPKGARTGARSYAKLKLRK